MSPDRALEDLLTDLFHAVALRHWLESGSPLLRAVAKEVSGSQAPLTALAHETAQALRQHGGVDEDLFLSLLALRPWREPAIQAVANLWGLNLTPARLIEAVQRKRGASEAPDEWSRADLVAELEYLLLERERHFLRDKTPSDLLDQIDRLARRLMEGGRARPGAVLAGTVLDSVIGRGNFGTVWRAVEVNTREERAVKVFHIESLVEGVSLWRFRRGIRAMKHLSDDRRAPENIARLYQVEPDTLAFSMPYFKGGNLEKIETLGWSLETKLDRFLKICAAVAFAHQIGIIHRDIKPANVVLDSMGQPVLTDFDISDIKFVSTLSVSRGGLGTPMFAAPEQLESGDRADERSDVYSLGRLLHFLLLERPPGLQEERDPALANLSALPAALVAVVRRATQWDPRRRYPNVASLIRDVEECQSGWAEARAHMKRGIRWVRYNWALLLIAGLVSGGSLGGYLWKDRVAKEQRQVAEEQRQAAERELMLRVQLGDIMKQIEALSARQEEIEARGMDLASLITSLRSEVEGLEARRNAPGVSEADQAEFDEQIAAKRALIEQKETEQLKIVQDLGALKGQIKAEQEKAEAIWRFPAHLDNGPLRSPEPPPPTASLKQPDETPRPTSTCTVEPSGGPSGSNVTAMQGSEAPIQFVGLTAGQFCMSSPEGERAEHAVQVSAYYLARSEVTQAQWMAVVQAAQKVGDADARGLALDPSFFKGATRPIEQVSWCDAARFANALSRLEGLEPAYSLDLDCESTGGGGRSGQVTGYRLPTEAEWEYAVWAGVTTLSATGTDKAGFARVGWYAGNSGGMTQAVCTAEKTPWGACDMYGNVREWIGYDCVRPVILDPCENEYTRDLPHCGGQGGWPPEKTYGDAECVLRGGSWSDDAGTASRFRYKASTVYKYVGFRLARSLPL